MPGWTFGFTGELQEVQRRLGGWANSTEPPKHVKGQRAPNSASCSKRSKCSKLRIKLGSIWWIDCRARSRSATKIQVKFNHIQAPKLIDRIEERCLISFPAETGASNCCWFRTWFQTVSLHFVANVRPLRLPEDCQRPSIFGSAWSLRRFSMSRPCREIILKCQATLKKKSKSTPRLKERNLFSSWYVFLFLSKSKSKCFLANKRLLLLLLLLLRLGFLGSSLSILWIFQDLYRVGWLPCWNFEEHETGCHVEMSRSMKHLKGKNQRQRHRQE